MTLAVVSGKRNRHYCDTFGERFIKRSEKVAVSVTIYYKLIKSNDRLSKYCKLFHKSASFSLSHYQFHAHKTFIKRVAVGSDLQIFCKFIWEFCKCKRERNLIIARKRKTICLPTFDQLLACKFLFHSSSLIKHSFRSLLGNTVTYAKLDCTDAIIGKNANICSRFICIAAFRNQLISSMSLAMFFTLSPIYRKIPRYPALFQYNKENTMKANLHRLNLHIHDSASHLMMTVWY